MERIFFNKDYLNKDTRLIGITGLAHVGKDTFAKYLKKYYNQIEIESFATPIKQIMINYFGFTKEQVYNQELKEVEDAFWNITPRRLMQMIGTEMFRECFRYDVWVKVFEKKFINNSNTFFVLADIRFDNEAKMIVDNGGIVIKINRDCERIENSCHKSEKGIDKNLIDITIDNNGTLEELENNAKKIIGFLNKG